MSGVAGGVFLHPGFGIDKTNKNIRYVSLIRSSTNERSLRLTLHAFLAVALHTSGCLESFSCFHGLRHFSDCIN